MCVLYNPGSVTRQLGTVGQLGVRHPTGWAIGAEAPGKRAFNGRPVPRRVVHNFYSPLPPLLPAVLPDNIALRRSNKTKASLTRLGGLAGIKIPPYGLSEQPGSIPISVEFQRIFASGSALRQSRRLGDEPLAIGMAGPSCSEVVRANGLNQPPALHYPQPVAEMSDDR
jgi:hypothetical protein